ncbi:MAG TPA: DinB family protein [Mycobacteriales bacterium]|jgi:uncharacterized damage-inducible protein DinB
MDDKDSVRRDADERTTLTQWLDFHRETLVRKVSGLTDEQARTSPVSINLAGLVSHLLYVERFWFTVVVDGQEDADLPWDDDDPDADPDIDWKPTESLDELVRMYREECRRSNEILARHDLDRVIESGPRHGANVRWVLVHMVEETARHNGHADIVRELLDGETGV